ncbi:hypothetical protein AB0F11_15410 [Streptomyces sp. NPDC032472]|uniref:LppU/SCO3897 family protein n=1 Tax=Streptomyces sp. NPDC032472 TaxID=3155018 RepID=UPI00340D5C02
MATPPPQHGAGPYPPYSPQQGGPYGPYAAGPGLPGLPGLPGPYGVPQYECRICGSVPAAPATVRGHQGMLVLMRFLRAEGPLCRNCGLATYRRMTSDTLWQGWWGPLSLFITPVTLLMNLGPRAAFHRLAPPSGSILPPLDPGRPLWRRPPALVLLVLTVLLSFSLPTLIVLGILAGEDKPAALTVGSCVRNLGDWKDQELLVVDCGSLDAQYRVHAPPCAGLEYITDLKYSADGTDYSCLTPLH